jgi:ribosome-associated translation inhibitor RaiA
MSGEQELKASEKLGEFINSINSYIEVGNLKFSGFKEEYLLVANYSSEQLDKLTQAELFDSAYLLYGYATYIQDEINKNKIALNWCQNELEKMIVKHSDEFGQYTKHESKKYILSQSNSYANSLEHMREVAESRLTALDGKVFEIKRKADILMEKGKRS